MVLYNREHEYCFLHFVTTLNLLPPLHSAVVVVTLFDLLSRYHDLSYYSCSPLGSENGALSNII